MTYHLLDKNKIGVKESLDLWELTFFNDTNGLVTRVQVLDDKTVPTRLVNANEEVKHDIHATQEQGPAELHQE